MRCKEQLQHYAHSKQLQQQHIKEQYLMVFNKLLLHKHVDHLEAVDVVRMRE